MSLSEATQETGWLQDNVPLLRVFNGYALMYLQIQFMKIAY